MSSAQLSEWLAYYRLEPWDSPWGAAAGTPTPEGELAFGSTRDINPQGRPVQTTEEQLAIVKQLNRMYGGRDLRESQNDDDRDARR